VIAPAGAAAALDPFIRRPSELGFAELEPDNALFKQNPAPLEKKVADSDGERSLAWQVAQPDPLRCLEARPWAFRDLGGP
jgi:hypothetical protein